MWQTIGTIFLFLGLSQVVRPLTADHLWQDEPLPGLEISSPQPGQAIQGTLLLEGTVEVEGFQSAQLAFSYSGDPTGSWFEIATIDRVIPDRPLATWDTNGLTDGDYVLRLTVILANDQTHTLFIEGIRVRNYSTIETNTPAPTLTPAPNATIVPLTPTPLPTQVRPTPTSLPPNPAQISAGNFTGSLLRGLVIAAVGFLILGIVALRASLRR